MELSEDTSNALKFLDYSTGDSLRKRNDLGVILEIGATFGEVTLVNDIIFYGAAGWYLSQSLKSSKTGDEDTSKLKIQFEETLEELAGLMTTLAGFGDDTVQKRFNEVYLAGTAGSLRNLLDIAHDLAKLKSLQKQLKNRKK